MTLADILQNEELRQLEFPVCRAKVFLAHAGVCPLPRRVAVAVANYVNSATTADQEMFALSRLLDEGRNLGARLLNCQPSEIAFVGPTSLALSFVAGGLSFRRHDNILVYHDDYPSNVYPWMALADKGVEVRLLNIRSLGNIRPRDVIGQVDENTRLVALASCHFVSGHRLEHNAIGAELRKRGILFCLDAIQTLGAFPTTVEYVDMLAADSHKWLLGPCGAGILYVRKEILDQVKPTVYGSNNVRSPDFIAQEQVVFRSGAKRYEPGSYNMLGIIGLNAALELALEIRVDNIAAELLRKRGHLVSALKSKDYDVLNADSPDANASGIVTFHKESCDLPALHKKLESAGVITSLRSDRKGRRYIRLSPHYYNTDAELNRALELL
ncbi:MAG TPA: aminotransferase class V-fold PLP-dependent enzyme [Verrucomicrobiota bacterium]|nr:aminotransferase class V-fold PLP-dependent enzyme [Verrucomicrobiota bacterium]